MLCLLQLFISLDYWGTSKFRDHAWHAACSIGSAYPRMDRIAFALDIERPVFVQITLRLFLHRRTVQKYEGEVSRANKALKK